VVVSRKMVAVGCAFLILVAGLSFLSPPVSKMRVPKCRDANGVVTDAGYDVYEVGPIEMRDHWIYVEGEGKVWVSPAIFLMYPLGSEYDWVIC